VERIDGNMTFPESFTGDNFLPMEFDVLTSELDWQISSEEAVGSPSTADSFADHEDFFEIEFELVLQGNENALMGNHQTANNLASVHLDFPQRRSCLLTLRMVSSLSLKKTVKADADTRHNDRHALIC
jgi:hypothetical protein